MSTARKVAGWLADWDGDRESQIGETTTQKGATAQPSLEDLAHLREVAKTLRSAASAYVAQLDVSIAKKLKGRTMRYGDTLLRFKHDGKWKPLPDAVAVFVVSAAKVLGPMAVAKALFDTNKIKVTGVRGLANQLDLDPDALVDTLLDYVKNDEPGIQEMPKKRWPKYAEDMEEGELR